MESALYGIFNQCWTSCYCSNHGQFDRNHQKINFLPISQGWMENNEHTFDNFIFDVHWTSICYGPYAFVQSWRQLLLLDSKLSSKFLNFIQMKKKYYVYPHIDFEINNILKIYSKTDDNFIYLP